MSAESSIKLRPYLSITECKLILSLLPESEKELREKFSVLLLKYDAGFIKGSYISNPRKTTANNLGFTDEDELRYLAGEMTEEESAAYEAALLK